MALMDLRTFRTNSCKTSTNSLPIMARKVCLEAVETCKIK